MQATFLRGWGVNEPQSTSQLYQSLERFFTMEFSASLSRVIAYKKNLGIPLLCTTGLIYRQFGAMGLGWTNPGPIEM